MGEFKMWVGEGMRFGQGKTLAGGARVSGDGGCCSLKIAAKSVRADMVSSQTLENGMSGYVFWKASVISLAAMSYGSVDDSCGI
jgi:hypothetical protein